MKRLSAEVSGMVLSILYIALTTPVSAAAEGIAVPAYASDSAACGMIEQEHTRGIDLWKAKNLPGALDRFKMCEAALKKRSLWMPPKLPEKATADQIRAHRVTNSVIFSLAAVYQQMGRRSESEQYADMARERGILPKVFMAGQRNR